MKSRPGTVWVVMHYEILGIRPCVYVDALQFHVSSTLKRAERYIQQRWVYPFSWWQVHPHVVDGSDPDEGDEVHYYSYNGRPLRRAPTKQAIKAYQRDCREHPTLSRMDDAS
jgi:hypothetical protein